MNYKITYANGCEQVKNLIQQKDFDILTAANAQYLKDEQQNKIKDPRKIFGDTFFTTESPIGLAMQTGELILPSHQGGAQKIKIELCND